MDRVQKSGHRHRQQCVCVWAVPLACVASVSVPCERNSGRVFTHSGCTKNEERAKKLEGGGWGRDFLLSPPPPRSVHLFALAPFFVRSECENLFRAARISFALFGNACYAGYSSSCHSISKWQPGMHTDCNITVLCHKLSTNQPFLTPIDELLAHYRLKLCRILSVCSCQYPFINTPHSSAQKSTFTMSCLKM